jgi:hypothetical protein
VDAAVLDAGGVAAHGLAAEEALAGGEVELPVVPLAGEDGVFAGALGEGIALVRAAIVDGVDGVAGADAGEAVRAGLAEHRAVLGEVREGAEIEPRVVRHAGVSL